MESNSPVRSAKHWTSSDIPPQAGRLAIITGATRGIGYETALALAGAGAEIVLAGRNAAKACAAMAAILAAHPCAVLSFRALDTERLSSVRDFAEAWRVEDRSIDVLILNAGIAWIPRRETTPDGFERQLATNFLGHYALAGLLLPSMRPEPGSRIIPVASLSHRRGRLHLDDLHLEQAYRPARAYRQSKLAMLVFALELDRKLRAAGSPVASVPAHPGWARTGIVRRGDRASAAALLAGKIVFRIIGQSAARAALPLLYAATAPEAQGGVYYGPDGVGEAGGFPTVSRIGAHALDERVAARLWAEAERLTGVTYSFDERVGSS